MKREQKTKELKLKTHTRDRTNVRSPIRESKSYEDKYVRPSEEAGRVQMLHTLRTTETEQISDLQSGK